MGDRCTVTIRCHKNTLPAFEKEFGSLEEGANVNSDGTITAYFHEVNYGGQSELQVLAGKGIPFVGGNEAGGDYGPACLCSVDGKYMEVEADMDGEPIIRTHRGKIDEESQKAVEEYMKHQEKAEAALLLPYEVNGPYEIVIKVTLQVDPDDVNKILPLDELQATAKQAIENALNLVENAGFSHDLANEVSIGVQSVEVEESK
jgi:hypothetical protein